MASEPPPGRRDGEQPWGARVPLLSEAALGPGQRWIHSAGFNIRPDLVGTARADAECGDLARLADHGCRVALLSHQGNHGDGSAQHLHYVADYLSRRLDRRVDYFPEVASPAAVNRAREMADGEIVLFGNTRFHPGEQANDPGFAQHLALLGDAVAVGGFSKAHRSHASNAGLLAWRPGYLTDGVAAELARLAPWAGADTERFSIAAVGGRKPEKIEIGLAELAGSYDLVLPGGAVLNALLAGMGYDIGGSTLGTEPDRAAQAASRFLRGRGRDRVHIPEEVDVARTPQCNGPPKRVRVRDGVPAGYAIVDFAWRPWALTALDKLASRGGRAVLAGPLSYYRGGYTHSTDRVLDAFAAPAVDALLLGGDTNAELPWSGPASTGGGSALQFLARGTCSVLDALRGSRASRTQSA
ncbi:phosphoglycerate kinase [Streptomonospora sp. PA3]|uniref:phosphoglycerate kinase n=1 Tax=Streptomonospora sp. PA3 TaxID=2607326 RepID=UPI0012DED983|nr:phosphoglycerate kinase [Streptomonospora sp. PA3]MUL43183.1 phosphoglycerate kinase [Streptomonospora sp. PA3]